MLIGGTVVGFLLGIGMPIWWTALVAVAVAAAAFGASLIADNRSKEPVPSCYAGEEDMTRRQTAHERTEPFQGGGPVLCVPTVIRLAPGHWRSWIRVYQALSPARDRRQHGRNTSTRVMMGCVKS